MNQRTNEKLQTENQFAQLQSEIKYLKGRISEIVPQSPVVPVLGDNTNQGAEVLANTSSNQSSVSNVCVREGENGENVSTPVGHSSVGSYLSNSEFPLPLFDENSDVNPVFHLRQLDEYLKLKGIPAVCQLAVAYRSLAGSLSRQWAETVSHQLSDYGSFRKTFLNTWWSASQQSLVKCSLYQGMYSRQSNLSLSAYFMKYATVASYLDPRPTDVEVIEAIRYHLPLSVQRAMLSTQLNSIGETLDPLKRVEVMENHEKNKNQSPTAAHGHNTSRPGPTQQTGDSNRSLGQIRRTQLRQNPARNNYCREPRRNFYRGERENELRTEGCQTFNPQAMSFNPSHGSRRATSPRINGSTNSGN
jgi:hypothetical protein